MVNTVGPDIPGIRIYPILSPFFFLFLFFKVSR